MPFLSFSSAKPLESQLPLLFRPVYQRAQTAFLRVGSQTAFIQSFAVLEILHVILGWVRSPLPTTASQVASRLFLVWGITEQFVEVNLPSLSSEPAHHSFSISNQRLGPTPSTPPWSLLGPQ